MWQLQHPQQQKKIAKRHGDSADVAEETDFEMARSEGLEMLGWLLEVSTQYTGPAKKVFPRLRDSSLGPVGYHAT